MAKTRNALIKILQSSGERLLGFFSRCEEHYFLPRLSRILKVGILGLLVSAVGWLLAKSVPYPGPMCYAPAPYWNVLISETEIVPNPTRGADSVTVRARAQTGDNPVSAGSEVSSAWIMLYGDTIPVYMHAVDGKFSDTLETVEGRLYVGDMEPESTWVKLVVSNSAGNYDYRWLQLVISEPDSVKVEK